MKKDFLKVLVMGFLCFFLDGAEKKHDREKIKQDWREIAQKNNLGSFERGGYLFVFNEDKPIFQGVREELPIKDYLNFVIKNDKVDQQKEQRRNLVSNYKIHLMPKDEYMTEVFNKLFELLSHEVVKKNLQSFKIYLDYNKTEAQQQKNERIFPRIVLYPSSSKTATQDLLNFLFEKLDHTQGMNITPSYNAKVTDLLYVAQGDGDDKKTVGFKEYYEKPHMIYYDANKIAPVGHKTHYLVHPKTKKQLLSPN